MKLLKQIVAVSIVLTMIILCFSGCGDNGENTTQASAESSTAQVAGNSSKLISIPFAKNDTLNPYRVKSEMNSILSTLLYDSLYTQNDKYEPVPQIADKSSVNGQEITINIKNGLKFSNGTALSAEDIVYSFGIAKSTGRFAERLKNISSISKSGSNAVIIKLASPDINALMSLIFPIIKKGSDETDVKGVSVGKTPIGSGRYILSEESGKFYLISNKSRLGGYSPKTEKLALSSVNDSDVLAYMLEIGDIGFLYDDLRNGSYTRFNASTYEIPLNNMIYLGFNNSKAAFANQNVKAAINILIRSGKDQIVQNAFQSHAITAETPFNPTWSGQSAYEPETNRTVEDAIYLLKEAGYTKINSKGIRYGGGSSLEFNLLVNKDNAFKNETAEYIKTYLAKLNIKVNIKALKTKEYDAAVKAWQFDMFIGEIKLTPNMSLSPMLVSGGGMNYGITAAGTVAAVYGEYLNGTKSFTEFMSVFNTELPFIPLCFRKGVAAGSRSIKSALGGLSEDIFSGIDKWAV